MPSPFFMTEDSVEVPAHTSDVRTEPEKLLTVRELADRLSVPASWIYERTRRRGISRIPHLKMGKYVRFRYSDVQAYLETLRRA
ncbi:MAG: DNA-binding protein [Acidobacteria bacterium]|nr:MAG: DNA-binding protein [Acidobacteriota bacterium]